MSIKFWDRFYWDWATSFYLLEPETKPANRSRTFHSGDEQRGQYWLAAWEAASTSKRIHLLPGRGSRSTLAGVVLRELPEATGAERRPDAAEASDRDSGASAGAGEAASAEARNVLFIVVDDLRPQLGAYGRSQMHTPHIDRLTEAGVMFERAYSNVPTCGPSRASFMTGLRPAPDRFVTNRVRAEEDAPGAPAMNDHFQKHGYTTVSLGKIFHHADDHRSGWSRPPWRPDPAFLAYQTEANRKLNQREGERGPPYESAERPDEAYPDGKLPAKARRSLKRLSRESRPFFLAVGFYKPHLPFVAPRRYWERYSAEDIHLPPNYARPEGVPDAAMHNFHELRFYHGVPSEGPVSDAMARRLIHGYYAATSFVDAQIGKVLDQLERLDLDP